MSLKMLCKSSTFTLSSKQTFAQISAQDWYSQRSLAFVINFENYSEDSYLPKFTVKTLNTCAEHCDESVQSL